MSKVLLLEKDSAVREKIVAILEASGLGVTVASTAIEAIEKSAGNRVKAAAIDLTLREFEHGKLFSALRASLEAPVIVTVHPGDEARAISAAQSGVEGFISRPFAPALLAGLLEGLIRRGRSWTIQRGR